MIDYTLPLYKKHANLQKIFKINKNVKILSLHHEL